ncbi:hypothetical protein AVEN_199838-1 [Araneus ventricosus]|uniref:Uncharacterized protein n=1 Tax=Araneus ventricosus TaxID=182803 RepID=A0A4Y2DS28_ARAVE|nr:hypothetical protein AVEN_199838-1 [Araneus ventricosus]
MERTLRGWREGVEMDLSDGRGFLLSFTRPEYCSSWVMKIRVDCWISYSDKFRLVLRGAASRRPIGLNHRMASARSCFLACLTF